MTLPKGAGGYAVGGRRRMAVKLQARNRKLALAESWTRHIPDDPSELVAALAEAGVDLAELREALP